MPPNHAYVDESRRGSEYLLALTLVRSAEVHATAARLRQVMEPGRQRSHFSAENPKSRRRFLDAYGRLGMMTHLAVAMYRGGDDEAARAICRDALAGHLGEWDVRVLIFDSRGPDRDRGERRGLAAAVARGQISESLHYTHRISAFEPLLSLPDAVGWCWGAGGIWRQRIEPLVESVIRP